MGSGRGSPGEGGLGVGFGMTGFRVKPPTTISFGSGWIGLGLGFRGVKVKPPKTSGVGACC